MVGVLYTVVDVKTRCGRVSAVVVVIACVASAGGSHVAAFKGVRSRGQGMLCVILVLDVTLCTRMILSKLCCYHQDSRG